MSSFEGSACNNCLKETSNWSNQARWIHINGFRDVSISAGKRFKVEGNVARIVGGHDTVDFCCFSCFLLYLNSEWRSTPPNYEMSEMLDKLLEIANAVKEMEEKEDEQNPTT